MGRIKSIKNILHKQYKSIYYITTFTNTLDIMGYNSVYNNLITPKIVDEESAMHVNIDNSEITSHGKSKVRARTLLLIMLTVLLAVMILLLLLGFAYLDLHTYMKRVRPENVDLQATFLYDTSVM